MNNSNFVFKTRRFSIFDFKKCRDLEIRIRGHSRSLKAVPFDKLRDFLLVLYRNFVTKMSIEIFDFKNSNNWVRGPSRSFEISPFDRAHSTSY